MGCSPSRILLMWDALCTGSPFALLVVASCLNSILFMLWFDFCPSYRVHCSPKYHSLAYVCFIYCLSLIELAPIHPINGKKWEKEVKNAIFFLLFISLGSCNLSLTLILTWVSLVIKVVDVMQVEKKFSFSQTLKFGSIES